jgi:hypothetical protein
MKKITFLLLFAALPLLSRAQTKEQALQNVKQRKGWYVGIGGYGAIQTTHWKYDQTPPGIGVPFYKAAEGFDHDVSRTLLSLGIEKRSLFGTPALREGIFSNHYDYNGNYIDTHYDPIFNFVDFDFGADVLFNPSAKTTANWLNDDNNQISAGGITAGASLYFRAQWLILLSPKLRMSVLSTAFGAQYMYFHNNGKDVATQALIRDFNYDKGWNENIAIAYFSVGALGFETSKFSILPEVRVFSLGTASTTLKPERLIGTVKMDGQPSVITYGIKIMKKL